MKTPFLTVLILAGVVCTSMAQQPTGRSGTSLPNLKDRSTKELRQMLETIRDELDRRDESEDPEINYFAELRRLDAEQLLAAARRIRPVFEEELLKPQLRYRAKYKNLVGKPDSGVTRIMERGRFEGLLRDGGCYYSFALRTHDYQREPDIELQGGQFSSGFAGGDQGCVMKLHGKDINEVTLQDVPKWVREAAAEKVSSQWTQRRELEQVKALRDEMLQVSRSSIQAEGDERKKLQKRLQELQTELQGTMEAMRNGRRDRARKGDLFVVRSVLWDRHDLLTAFEVVERTKHGVTIAWKILKRYPKPVERR